MMTVTAMHEQMHQQAGEQQQEWQVIQYAGEVGSVFHYQEVTRDQNEAD
jgi:hypothetical protein